MCKCCSGARSVSQKCKIKGKWKSGKRWKRAIRLATVEWVSAMLSDIARRHYQLLASASLNRHPASRAAIATTRHFVTHEFCFAHLFKPVWVQSAFIPLAITLMWVWLHIRLNCKSVRFEDKCAGADYDQPLISPKWVAPEVQAEIVLAVQIARTADCWAR